jgi:hypothetical protein
MKSKQMVVFLFACFCAWSHLKAQDDKPTQNTATINYSIGDLEKMDKLELTQIYIAKLKRLNAIIVYLPFAKLEPQSPNDLKIPANSENEKAITTVKKSINTHNNNLEGTMNSLIPYADKKQIIESILFLQHIINKIELIGLGMTQLGY